MSDDGRELERPTYKAAALVDAILAPVPFGVDERRPWAERIAAAIMDIAAPWLSLDLGKTEEQRANEIANEIRREAGGALTAVQFGELQPHETFFDRAIVKVLTKRIAALEGQARVVPPPPLVQPYHERKGPDGTVTRWRKPEATPTPGDETGDVLLDLVRRALHARPGEKTLDAVARAMKDEFERGQAWCTDPKGLDPELATDPWADLAGTETGTNAAILRALRGVRAILQAQAGETTMQAAERRAKEAYERGREEAKLREERTLGDKDHPLALLRNRLGDEWLERVPLGPTSVSRRRHGGREMQFVLDIKTLGTGRRVFVEPPEPKPHPHEKGAQLTVEAVRELVGATSDTHTVDAVREALYQRERTQVNILKAVGGFIGMTEHPMPAGSPAHAEAVFEAVKKLKAKADAVCPELRAVQWKDEAGDHEQIMGLEMASSELGRMRTEFAAFQKTANDEQARTEKKLGEAVESAARAWRIVETRDNQLRAAGEAVDELRGALVPTPVERPVGHRAA